jgi:hypothetical protein
VTTPDERFDLVVEALIQQPGVTPPGPGRSFGSGGLKVEGRIFAMLVRGRLVVKLPRGRVDALVDAGDGVRYDPRRDGRLMREWLDLHPTSTLNWLGLATEALEFVRLK